MGYHSVLSQAGNQSLSVFLSRVNPAYSLSYKNDYCYCIVEGTTDVDFYRIYLQHFYDKIKVIPVAKVDGKMNCCLVIEHLKDFNRNINGNKKQFLFFIDRDFDYEYVDNTSNNTKQNLNPNIPKNYGNGCFDDIDNPENLYITDAYSIENSIFTRETVKNIFEYLKKPKKKDKRRDYTGVYETIGDLYEQQLQKFEMKLVRIIAILIYCKRNNIDYKLDSVKFKEYIEIDKQGYLTFKYVNNSNQCVNENSSAHLFDETILQEKLKHELVSAAGINESSINDADVVSIENEIRKGKIFKLFRGHFLEDFWKIFGKQMTEVVLSPNETIRFNKHEYDTHDSYIYCGAIRSLNEFAFRTVYQFGSCIGQTP